MILVIFIFILILIILSSPNKNREMNIPVPTYYHNSNQASIYHKLKPNELIGSTSKDKIYIDENNMLYVEGFISKENPKTETLTLRNQEKKKINRIPWLMKDNTHKIKELLISAEDPLLFDIAEKYKINVIKPKFSGSLTDIWLRDEFKIGYINRYPFILNGPRNKGLDSWIENYCQKRQNLHHFHLENNCPNNSYNFFGNLICLSPNKILCGVNQNGVGACNRILEFIKDQNEQELITINTSWLTVGHVDEVVTVMPDGKIAMVSPSLAIKQLSALPRNLPILLADKVDTVGNVLNKYQQYNLYLDHKMIEPIRKKLKPEINLPVLFYRGKSGKANALTFNLANIIVDPRFMIVPKNNGPVVNGIPRWGKKLWNHFYPKTELYQIDQLNYIIY